MSQPIKPPVTYFGGKTRIADRIVALFPPHGHYVELFGGSLAVLLAKRPSDMETVNDLDGALMTFWRVLRDRPADLERVCALTPHSRAEHERVRRPNCVECGQPLSRVRGVWLDERRAGHCPKAATVVGPHQPETFDDLETARRVWVKLSQGRGGHTSRPTGWRHYQDARGSHASMPDYLAAYVGRIMPCAARLARVSLESRPALELVELYGKHRATLLYADPPYPGLARWDSDRRYEFEMLDEQGHRELAIALNAARASVLVSGYDSPLYDELYAGWNRREIPASAGVGNGEERARTEVVWSNREFPVEQDGLFDV